MSLGPRLVIPGSIFGAAFLVIFLYTVTAGIHVPTAAASSRADAQASSPATSQAESSTGGGTAGVQSASLDWNPANPTGACAISPSFPEKIRQWCGLITLYAQNHGLEPDLIAALILQESGGDPVAYSKSGAVGLMQVMPRDGLASSFMCKNGPCFTDRPSINELQDPEYNISYGTNMLADLISRHGNVRDALKSYGPMNVGYYYADIVLGLFESYGQ